MCGCELNDDGTKRGYWQYGYDGEDFVSFDKSSLTWTAANPQAVITKHKWDADKAFGEYNKGYLENTCIEWLQKYVRYGKDTLERKVSCHATGFYPSGVTVTWQKNGQEHIEDVDLGQLIPNEDGTFQVTSTITVTPDELKNNKFSCVVEHQGKTISSILTEDKIKTNYGESDCLDETAGIVVSTRIRKQDLIYAQSACNTPKRKENLKSHHMTPLMEIICYRQSLISLC
uniref:Major histocompatibility complex class I-related gene protein-like n=1 Tax=Sinocyclocheilus rhinocerous TaxID=307959 RepID=A0A673LZV2_9TELE